MKFATLAAAAALSISSTLAFAQATNAPGASTIGGDPNPNVTSPSSAGGSASQTGNMGGGAAMNNNGMNAGSGMTTGSGTRPAINDASKSGAPAADNAMKTPGTTTPDNSTQRR